MSVIRDAEALGAAFPPLLLAAERVAATVAQGVHGRRRPGQGDSFWQYRPFLPGDAPARIDWRRSARGDRLYVRETEWEAAETLCLWSDHSPRMAWRSSPRLVEKRERASLLMLAVGALALRAGERLRLASLGGHSFFGRGALERLLQAQSRVQDPAGDGLPSPAGVPADARVLLVSDFLAPEAELSQLIAGLAARPAGGCLLQVLDPAEVELPYAGRVRFRGLGGEAARLVPRVEALRERYRAALAERQAMLARLAGQAGFGFAIHVSSAPPEQAVLAVHLALSARRHSGQGRASPG